NTLFPTDRARNVELVNTDQSEFPSTRDWLAAMSSLRGILLVEASGESVKAPERTPLAGDTQRAAFRFIGISQRFGGSAPNRAKWGFDSLGPCEHHSCE